MNLKTAECYLFGYRKEKQNDPTIEKAVRLVDRDAELARRLNDQVEFDRQVSRAVQAILPPPDIRQRVGAKSEKRANGRPKFMVTAVIATLCGLGVIVALIVMFAMDRYQHFPGREMVGRMVASANSTSDLELQPVSLKAGQLSDWFYMRGFEGYGVPNELAGQPAVGSRLFKQEGSSVAQVLVNCDHSPLMYVFKADEFGVDLPSGGDWRLFTVDDWQAAVRKDGNTCTMLAFRGTEQEMRDLLRTLKKP